jgi:formate hydrogenlyase transcriptional activator
LLASLLERVNWKVSGQNGAAQILELNRSTLRARMRKLILKIASYGYHGVISIG